MLKRIKRWFSRRPKQKPNRDAIDKLLAEAYNEGYNRGKSDGLAIARKEAAESLRRALQ